MSIFPDVVVVLNRKEQGDATCVLSETPRYSAMLLSVLISDTFQIWILSTCLAPSAIHAASQLQQMNSKLPVLSLLYKGTISAWHLHLQDSSPRKKPHCSVPSLKTTFPRTLTLGLPAYLYCRAHNNGHLTLDTLYHLTLYRPHCLPKSLHKVSNERMSE